MVNPPEYVEKFDFDPAKVRVHNPLVRFFGGLRFGLTTLTMIAIASTIGEFLPYENDFSIRVVFRTWWYQALLFMQGTNLILNTYITYVEETYPQFLPLFRKNADQFKKALKINLKIPVQGFKVGDAKALMHSLAGALGQRQYRTFYDGNALYAHRGLLARFGSTITHLGLITIITGSLIEARLKIQGTLTAIEEDTIDFYTIGEDRETKHKLDFAVKVHDFEFTNYPGTETASKYKSTVTFIPKDGEPTETYVRVNHDVTYQGWTFHQTSFTPIEREDYMPRYFVNLAEKLPDGAEKLVRFETYLEPEAPRIMPLPGRDDVFFAVEPDPSGRAVIWSVASKEKILARGSRSLFGDLRIEMVRFLPDMAVDPVKGVYNKSDEQNNPAALIEVVSDNTVAFRQWIFTKENDLHARNAEAHGESEDLMNFVITDIKIAPETLASAAPPGGVMGAMGKDLAQAPKTGESVETRALVTVALKTRAAGGMTGQTYELRVGEPVPLTGGTTDAFDIPGPYEVRGFTSIPAYVTHLDVSHNPGIPIVWLGAILATLGPFIAFFVSRRRVWAWYDEARKTLWVGAESRYSREALEEELAEVVENWGRSEPVKIEPEVKLPKPGEPPPLSQYL